MGLLTNYWFVLVVGLVLSLGAQIYVKTTFSKQSKTRVSCGMTSNRFLNWMFSNNGITDVSVKGISGSLTDNYSNKDKAISLSESTYNRDTVAAIAVAAHECGHAVQYNRGYAPVFLRSVMVPVVNIGSNLGIIILMLSVLLTSFMSINLEFFVNVGLILYSTAFLFTLITLPVEFNASRRAMANIRESNFFSQEETSGMRKVLTAAAMTYVASMFVALLNLIRIVLIFRRD